MPAGVAPVGSETGELGSSVRFPPFTAKAATASTRLSSTYSVRRKDGVARICAGLHVMLRKGCQMTGV